MLQTKMHFIVYEALFCFCFFFFFRCQKNFNFMACFEVMILKNPTERALNFLVKDGVNSIEKEVTTNEISLSLDLIDVKNSHNFYGGVPKL